MEQEQLQIESPNSASPAPDRLEGWKEIAAYLKRTVRTVQRWEKEEGLPVHRHQHQKLGSVTACKTELDGWLKQRQNEPDDPASDEAPAAPPSSAEELEAESGTAPAAVASRRFTLATGTAARLIILLTLAAAVYPAVKWPTDSTVKVTPPAARNSAAYDAYLKGRYTWHKDTREWFEQSAQFFETTVKLDPNFAQGWAGLATTYATMGLFGGRAPKNCFPQAQSAAERALALDPSLAEARAALGQVKFYWSWDRSGAEKEFLAALELDPSLAIIHQSYAYFLSAVGRHDEAIAEAKRAQELEPLSATINSTAGWFYYIARRYDEALAQWRKTLELEPQFHQVQSAVVAAYCKQGKYEQARVEEIKYLRMIGLGASVEASNSADPKEALRNFNRLRLERLKRQQENLYVAPGYFVKAYAELNEREPLFQWLETALAERDCVITMLNVHPLFDQVKTDPRFLALTNQLGLLSEKRQG